MKKYKDTDYLHVSVRLRAVAHKTSVDEDTLLKIVDASSVEAAVKLLEEKGLAVSDSSGDKNESAVKKLDKALTEEQNKAYGLVTSIIGSSPLVSLLKVRYDFMNLKALIKAEMLGISPDSMLVDSGNISLPLLKEAFRVRDRKYLDGVLASVTEETVRVASETGDPQRIDLMVDKACFEYIMSRCDSSGFDFLSDYFKAKADLTNLMIFIRCRRMGKDYGFFAYALLPYFGAVSAEKLKEYYQRPEADFYEMLASTPYRSAFAGIDSENVSVRQLEAGVDSYLKNLVRKMNSVSFGPQVVVGYLLGKENEISNIRIALSSVISGSDPEKTKEKLRV